MSAPNVTAVATWFPRERMWGLTVKRCPHCKREHRHGGGSDAEPRGGHRLAHCVDGGAGYVLVVKATSPATDLRTAKRILGRGVPVEWVSGYVGAVLRVRTPLRHGSFAGELSCLVSELEAVKPWIEAGGVGPLPVPEYHRSPWGVEYRWTGAANLVALEIDARRLEKRRSA